MLPRGRFILMGAASNPLVRQYLAANHATPPAKDEAYILRGGPDAVVVAGNDDAGAFYGLQSLRQLIDERWDGCADSRRGRGGLAARSFPRHPPVPAGPREHRVLQTLPARLHGAIQIQ